MIQVEEFCRDWLFVEGDAPGASASDFDDADWLPVIIPHTWNADDMRPGAPMEQAYIGPAWYRKRFRCEPPSDDERIFLLFEAVANRSEVWVDNCFVGGRDGGFLSFRLDITEALANRSDHVVAVRADNAFENGSVPPDPIDWERYGGIYRLVFLGRAGGAHFEHMGVRVRVPHLTADEAVVQITSNIREVTARSRPLLLVHELFGPEDGPVARAEVTVDTACGRSVTVETVLPPLGKPALWSPETPVLYRVASILYDGDRELDRVSNPLGFRWFSFDADAGFSLNGCPVKLCGVNAHQDFIGLGNACPERVHRRDLGLMKEAGINFLRTSHYPRDDRTLDLCDRLGIMVMEEQPFWHGSLRASGGEKLLGNARRLLRDMVQHHGNHPCIILWNTVNEIMLTPIKGEPHPDPTVRAKRHRLQEEEWPFALRTIEAMNDILHAADPDRPTVVVVGAGWERNDQAGVTRLADIVAYNGGAVNDLSGTEPVYDLCRRCDPHRISMMSEGVLNDTTCARADWNGELVAWECYAAHWSRFYQRPWFCGGSMWVWADYSAKGTYRTRGMVDAARLPYESFHFFKAMWNPALSVHICGHWDWPGQEGKMRRVAVFTNARSAELFVNGRSCGVREPDLSHWPELPHPPLEWSLPYEPGELRVVAVRDGEEVEDSRTTSDAPVGLLVEPEDTKMLANGRDVAFFRIQVTDEHDRLCYCAAPDLYLAVRGPARLVGPAVVSAAGGLARVAIRSDGVEGLCALTAASAGIPEAIGTVQARVLR